MARRFQSALAMHVLVMLVFYDILQCNITQAEVTRDDSMVTNSAEDATTAPWEDRRQHPLSTVDTYRASTASSVNDGASDDVGDDRHLQRDIRSESMQEYSDDNFKRKTYSEGDTQRDGLEGNADSDEEDEDDIDADVDDHDDSYQDNNSYEQGGKYQGKLLDTMMNDYRDTSKTSSRRKTQRKAKKKNAADNSDRTRLEGYSNEYRLKEKLLFSNYYDKTTRPVRSDDTSTTLYVGMSLYHILDTNEKYQTLSALIAIRLRWIDEYMRWNTSEYGGLERIWVPAVRLWTPDIFINNFADDSFQDFMDTYAIVSSTGEVLWMFPAVVKTYCTLDVRHFPFDRQMCNIVFISWTFHGFKLNLTYDVNENQTVYYTPKNQEWYVDQLSVKRNEKIYTCCIEPYPDVTFTIHMTRRSLFYIINLIFPCLLIYAVAFLGFFLPVESGEKVNLEITILLALVVFLLIVGETLPPTPDAIPALGLLFGLTMIMVSIALVMAVVVTNIFLRKDHGKRVPQCLRTLFLRSAPSRHGYTDKVTTVTENHVNDVKHNDMEMDSLSMLSEFENLTCKARNCSTGPNANRRASLAAAAAHNRGHCRRDVHVEDSAETYLCEKYSQEWQSLAKNVDRFFFWLFLVASIGALVSMFCTIPHMNAT